MELELTFLRKTPIAVTDDAWYTFLSTLFYATVIISGWLAGKKIFRRSFLQFDDYETTLCRDTSMV